MDGSSLIVVDMPIMILIALFTGIALPFITGSRFGRSHAGRRLARADRLKRIGGARRKARAPTPGASNAAPVEYLYVPCTRIRYHGYSAGTRRWVQEVPIVKKTAQWIYYSSDTWDRSEAVVSPGRISREQFETDTRCHDNCPRDIAAGLVCAAQGAKHGYTWEHCPRGEDRCRHGYPAGVIPIPGDRPRPGRLAGYSSPPARPPKPTFTAGNASEPDRPHGKHHPSRNCAARWPTLTPTVAAQPSSSSKRAIGTRRRLGPRDGNVLAWPAPADPTVLRKEQTAVPAKECRPVTGWGHAPRAPVDSIHRPGDDR